MSFVVSNIFHSTQLVNDLNEAREWFAKVFDRRSSTEDRWDRSTISSEYSIDYSFLIQIGDLVHDSICPALYRTNTKHHNPKASKRIAWDSPEGLTSISWWIHGSKEFSQAMADRGISLVNQAGYPVPGGDFGSTLITPNFSMMTTSVEQTGFLQSFTELLPPHLERYIAPLPRLSSNWKQTPVRESDPLSIDRTAYHTITTTNLARVLHFYVDVLNGKVIHRDETGFETVFVYFADTVIKLVAVEGDPQAADKYKEITFRTADLAKVKKHLARCGISLADEHEDGIVTNPKDCMGVRWGFVSELVPGDPRMNNHS